MSRLRSPEEAEDAMQSTFLRAFSAMQKGVEPDYEAAWLFKIAHNVCLSRSLASARRGRVEAPADLQAMQDEIGGPVRERDELIRLDDALAEMPERLRTAFLLREWQGLSYQEIADRLEISHSAVETLIFRARKHLANALTEPAAKAAKRVRAALESLGLSSVVKGLFGGAAAQTAAVAVGLAGITAAGVVGGTLVAAPNAPATASTNPDAAAAGGSFGSLPTPALSPGLALLVGLPLEQVGWLPGSIGGVLGVQTSVGTTAGNVVLAAGVAGVAAGAAVGGSATGSASGGPFGSAFPVAQPSGPSGTGTRGSLPLVGSAPAPPSATVPGTTFPTPVPGVTTPVPGVTTPVPGVTPPTGGTTPTVPIPTTPTVTKPSVTVPTVSVTTPTVPRPTVTTPTVLTTPTVPTPSVTLPTVTTPTVTTPTVPKPTVTTPTVPKPTVTTPTVPIPTVTTPSVTVPTVPPPPLPKPPPPPPPPPITIPTLPPPPPPPITIPTLPPPPPIPTFPPPPLP
jgi:RNA polymerase sigma factor (sigma-70 family)